MSAKDFKQHMLNELIELERLIRNDCGRDNGLGTSYEPEELKWFEKLYELQELCEGDNIDASDSKLPLCGVRLSLPDAKQEVAELYDKEDWQEVLHDYEYGLGISKLIDFEQLMDKVAILHAGNEA